MQMELDIDEALELWQSKVQILKQHIFTKRQQFAEIRRITENLDEDELIIHLDYSENYKCQQQNEIQSACFGHKQFSLFTACTYYRSKEVSLEKLPITVTTEENDKSRIASISCVNKVISHSITKVHQEITKVYIVSDGCSAQFRSRYVFYLLTCIHQQLHIEWHYNEAHHGKGPMDGIGGAVKNLVYRRVLSGDVVINYPKEFADFANEISNVDSLFLPNEEVLEEPQEVQNATAIPTTTKIHKVVRGMNKQNTFCNKFYFLSSDVDPFFTQWYGLECGHTPRNVDDNTCCHCYENYQCEEEWLKCPVCEQWYHDDCFYL